MVLIQKDGVGSNASQRNLRYGRRVKAQEYLEFFPGLFIDLVATVRDPTPVLALT